MSMIRLLAVLPLILPVRPQDEPQKAVLVFEAMHCDECRAEIEAILKKVQGFKSVATEENRVTLAFEDKAPIPSFTRVPRDLQLREVVLEVSGTVSFDGDKAALVTRGSGEAVSLVNPEKPKPVDRLAELRREMGGKNRFRVRGFLAGARKVVLESFRRTDWKDTP
jgi:copper chaperone CopZ